MTETNLKYPLVIEVVMYKNNIIDNRILSEVRRNAHINQVGNSISNFYVPATDIKEILNDKFEKDFEQLSGLTNEQLSKRVNSAFFLHNVVRSFTNLKFIKFNVSDQKHYTRKTEEGITFDYKILHAKIDLPDLFDSRKLIEIQYLLKECGLWEYNSFFPKPYIEISSRDLIGAITQMEGSEEFVQEHAESINMLMDVIDMKMETDNTLLHLIVLD
jgi:hypothetical protein